jgi:hypothetical protein
MCSTFFGKMVDWCGGYVVVPPAYSQIVCVIDEIFNRSFLCIVPSGGRPIAGTAQLDCNTKYNGMKMDVRRTASFCFVGLCP